MRCPRCQFVVFRDIERCPSCGEVLQAPAPPRTDRIVRDVSAVDGGPSNTIRRSKTLPDRWPTTRCEPRSALSPLLSGVNRSQPDRPRRDVRSSRSVSTLRHVAPAGLLLTGSDPSEARVSCSDESPLGYSISSCCAVSTWPSSTSPRGLLGFPWPRSCNSRWRPSLRFWLCSTSGTPSR